MAIKKKDLYVKKSTIPDAGNGLFTKVAIEKGERIAEYKGKVLTWKQVGEIPEDQNGYIFYFNKNHVINAWNNKKSLAHFANDAKGLVKIKSIKNNSEFTIEGERCFLDAIRNIEADSEIFVDYGREYWQAIRYNIKLEEKEKSKEKESK